jgi:arylsulfatase A-like enzyme
MTKCSILISLFACSSLIQAKQKPNVIVILTDDQGYQDLGCYGSPLIKTPCIDKMALEGLKLTDFYQSSSISSPSRAGLLTGKLNSNNGVKVVYFPEEKGLPKTEITLAEALKTQGYKTACFGKWHLGDLKGYLPTDHGFDEYFGIPYSNDMYIAPSQQFASNVNLRETYNLEQAKADQEFVRTTKNKEAIIVKLGGKCPLMQNDEIVEYPCDLATTTQRYFEHAIQFVEKNKKQPFFMYITPAMPHVPLFASEKFRGKSKRGLYGDVVEELDWNVGQLLAALDKNKLSENTIVIFTSDNGPWLTKKQDGGSADPLRDGKFSIYEGGVRVPCLIRWKGTIPKGVISNEIVSGIDVFPTIMHLAGVEKLSHKVDGTDISKFLKKPSIKMNNEYVYVKYGKVSGVRKGEWVYLDDTGKKQSVNGDAPELFNLKQDISQQKNVFNDNMTRVSDMKKILEKYINTKVAN